MLDAKIRDKAVSLVTRAKAHNEQWDVCWHGWPTYGYGCGIRGFDTQYGEPVECVWCENGDNPPWETPKLYPWALATVRGQRWIDPDYVRGYEGGEEDYE